MKSCPTCRRLYPDDAGFCPIDGVALKSATDVPPAPSEEDARIGGVLAGRYQIRRVVADGGMGRVYEALDVPHKRRVALKVLHADVAKDKVALERFKREFEISNQLPHEHIAEVFDFQRVEGDSYALAMDYLEGEELRAVLKRDKFMRPERLVRMLSQVAIGLDEAHRRHLIHRDLKPDNIFLCGTREGDVVKILDFGSVKDKSEGAKKLTVMGTTIGSPFYMSPEQAQGLDTLDARADVWALAAIAYECVTGQVPFKGNNGPSILLAILTQHPTAPSKMLKPSEARYPIPPGLDDVLDEAFAKNVGMRVASVGALADKVGQAYGLTGTHRDWAYTTQQDLGERVEAAMPGLLAARTTVAVEAEADPFASKEALAVEDPFAPTPVAAAPALAKAGPGVPAAGDASLGATRPSAQGLESLPPAGVPKGSPVALIIVGVLAFFAAVAVVVVILLLRR